MMSHLAHGIKSANCVRGRKFPGSLVEEVVRRHHEPSVDALGPEDYCAAHLATLTETAAESLDEMAVPVNYERLPEALYREVFVDRLGMEIGEAAIHRLEQTAMQYSKGRGSKAGEFTGDSTEKEKMASDAVRKAAATYLQDSYDALEGSPRSIAAIE